jgi:alkylation response protein AidB-like acyl-CoA dehydrogenase
VSGDPVRDAVTVAEIRGQHLQPEPFAACNVAAAVLSRHSAGEPGAALLGAIAEGRETVLTAVAGDATWSNRGDVLSVSPDGSLDGSAVRVGRDRRARWLLAFARCAEGGRTGFLVPLDAPGVSVRPLAGLDVTRPLDGIRLDGVPPEALVRLDEGEAAAEVAADLGALLGVADSVGAMTRLFDTTVEYAAGRIAFGRPIGSFQAVKHLLADLGLFLECATAVAAGAARALAEQRPGASEAVSLAQFYLSERAAEVAQGCLQVHGGIGFTWEHDLHLYLRRLAANAVLHGTLADHRARIAAHHREELLQP